MFKKILVVIISIIIASVGISLWIDLNDDDSEIWYYDDYKIVTDVNAVGGSLELIEINGVQYVHAYDTGYGTITYSSGKTDSFVINKAKLDVYLQAGQSNAGYTNANPSEALTPKIGTSYYYGYESRPITTLDYDSSLCKIYSLTNEDGSSRLGDKAPAFCKTYNDLTGRKVLYVITGVSSMGIDNFLPYGGVMWDHMQSVLNDAIDSVDKSKFDVHIKSYLWYQGETDMWRSPTDYQDKFLLMNYAIINGKLGYKFDFCFISKVPYSTGWSISAAQMNLVDESRTIIMGTTIADTFTKTNGLMGPDELHYTQSGNNILGTEMAKSVVSTYGIGDNTYRSPTVSTILNSLPIFVAISLAIGVCAIFFMKHRRT